MILTVQIPVAVTRPYGRGGSRLSYETTLMPIVTNCVAIRRAAGGLLEADAFIKDEYRGQIEGPASKWIDIEYRRCICRADENRKTLRDFLESGDAEWDLRGDK